MALRVGDKLGSREILALVGEGSMGSVWKGRDTRLGRIVSLKVLSEDGISGSGARCSPLSPISS